MRNDQALDKLVEMASDMKLRLTRLLDLYGDLEPIVHREHDSIRAGDMAAVGDCQERKGAITDAVDAEYQHLQEDCRQIAEMRKHFCPDLEVPKTVTMKQTLNHILDLCDAIVPNRFGRDVVMHQVRGVEENLEAFDDKVKDVQPLLEMNMYIVSTMLTNIQESYRFHISLVEEEASAYNEKGVKKSKGMNSGFKVGA